MDEHLRRAFADQLNTVRLERRDRLRQVVDRHRVRVDSLTATLHRATDRGLRIGGRDDLEEATVAERKECLLDAERRGFRGAVERQTQYVAPRSDAGVEILHAHDDMVHSGERHAPSSTFRKRERQHSTPLFCDCTVSRIRAGSSARSWGRVVSNVIPDLLEHEEASARWLTHRALDATTSKGARAAAAAIADSPRVRKLLSERDRHGNIARHPYHKWMGAHWVLVSLADLGYPPGDASLIPMRE